jgi:hypothetical protein
MRRVALLVVALLAVVALAAVSASVDTVSTEPTVDSPSTPVGTANLGGGGGGSAPEDDEGRTAVRNVEAGTAAGSGSETGLALWQVAVGLGLLVLGSAVALYGLTRGRDEDDPVEESPTPEPTAPAADSVTLAADAPATNDVYRAWNALCRAVPVESAGRTPADVAAAAVDAGYGPEAVADLTDSFCAVRYGGADPTSERERRARDLAAALSLSMEGSP